ncbi:MAG: hypothetical protein IID15_08085, partial [Candidatus Marinimicrobia bacterium]|nr:hypothetical protein [Candidatus Neomarinimicrobiota bacterium]
MTRSHMAIIGLAFLMLAPDLNGQIPKKITYQGVVRDVNGDLYPDGPINLLFRIYDATTAGNLHHEEFHSTTNVTIPDTVKNGTFTAVLGPQAVGVYANLDLLSPSIPLWLEIAIWDGFEWDIQLPRTAFTTVLYAASAAEVARADTAGIIIGDNIFPSSGNVGIGTTSPDQLLTIGDGTGNPRLRIYGNDGGVVKQGDMYVNSSGQLVFNSDDTHILFQIDDITRFSLTTTGGTFNDGFEMHFGTSEDTAIEYNVVGANEAWLFASPNSYEAYFGDRNLTATGDITALVPTQADVNLAFLDADEDSYLQIGFHADDTTAIQSNQSLNLQPASGNVCIGPTSPYSKLSVWAD